MTTVTSSRVFPAWLLSSALYPEAHDQKPVGPDQATLRVGEDLSYAHPDLSDELYLVNREMRAGCSWDEALCYLSERTGVDDIKALVDALVQAGPLGVMKVLRAHSDSLRTERRQRAEEQAAKTTIKMVPSLVIFVLPSIIFVTIGPAIIELVRQLGPVSGER